MNTVNFDYVSDYVRGKTVAIVGSGPGCLDNDGKFIDGHDIVVRINNYKLIPEKTGKRTDIYYSYYGGAIKKTRDELIADGVKLLMAKCPDSQPIDSEWHRRNGKIYGIDFRPIYRRRADWFFCQIYIPTDRDFLAYFNLLGKHIPTTGFSCILDFMRCECKSIYITGFDFFTSGVHNVDERWKHNNRHDPIGHVPEKERAYLIRKRRENITYDKKLRSMLGV